MTYVQIASIIGAVLAVAVGAAGMFFSWFSVQEGLGLIFSGLAILGIHQSGSVAGSIRNK